MSLHSTGWFETSYVDQAGLELELTEIYLLLPGINGLSYHALPSITLILT